MHHLRQEINFLHFFFVGGDWKVQKENLSQNQLVSENLVVKYSPELSSPLFST